MTSKSAAPAALGVAHPRVPRPPNPYVLTPLTGGVGFYGRDSVLQFVRNTLASPYQNVIVLYGQRRIGKTSVLHQLTKPRSAPPGFRPIYFDLQGRAEHGLGQVLFGLAREIARSVALEIPPREAFAEESFFQYGFLPQVYRRVGNDRLLVLVDEFDVLGGEPVTDDAAYNILFGYLQDLLIDEQKRMAFVFVVGRRIDELPSRIKATFKSAQCKRITVLDRAAAIGLITEPAAGLVEFDDDAVDALLHLTAGHPYFLQLLCYELFDRSVRSGRKVVTPADLTSDLVEAAMELGMGGLAWFWDEFPPAERFILSAIAHLTAQGKPATLEEIGSALRAHGVRLQGMELSTAPRSLADWDIMELAGRDAWRFRVEFLRRWIYAKHSLEEAKRELEQVSARAVRIYETARQAHEQGDLGTAIEVYRRALAANPNHARAQLGFGQALYEAGHFEAATENLEKAYRLDPESARDGLLAAHRDLGAMLENESHLDQARPHYQRILDLSPADETAKVRMRDCWRATAGIHLASGRWDKAAEAYREALRYVPDDPLLQDAVEKLEERHLEVDAANRRREQLERAVLESRLDEEQARRTLVEASMRGIVGVVVGVAAVAVIATALLLGSGTAAAWHWPTITFGALMTVGGAYLWARRQLGG